AFHEYLVDGNSLAVNPAHVGTKAGAVYTRTIAAGASFTWRLRLTKVMHPSDERRVFASPFVDFDTTFKMRQREADEFYTALQPVHLDEDQRRVHRQALAGMLWNKQFYHFIVEKWLQGDPAQPPPPAQRTYGRNHEWRHMFAERVR